MTNVTNVNLEEQLQILPEQVAGALEKWRVATLDREKCEALLYATIKGTWTEASAAEIKSAINRDQGRYNAVLAEIKAESNYNLLYEKLLSAKKLASLRTAF